MDISSEFSAILTSVVLVTLLIIFIVLYNRYKSKKKVVKEDHKMAADKPASKNEEE